MSKLNSRQLIIHFVASWFFIYAFHTLSTLYDYSFLFSPLYELERGANHARFASDMVIINESGAIGLLVAYIISWQISLRRNWFWVNSVIVFIIAFVLKYYNLLGWSSLQNVFLAPGHIFRVNSVACFIMNGLIMLTIGLLLLFLRPVKRYIDAGVKPVAAPDPQPASRSRK